MKKTGRPRIDKDVRRFKSFFLDETTLYIFKKVAKRSKKTYSQFVLELLELYRLSK